MASGGSSSQEDVPVAGPSTGSVKPMPRLGCFIVEEDVVMLTCIDKFGFNLEKMQQYLPGRTMSQLLKRWTLLSNDKITINWTPIEDNKLMDMVTSQDNVTDYAGLTVHFPGRDKNDLKARHRTILTWMRRHPGRFLGSVPLTGNQRVHPKPSMALNEAVDNLKKKLKAEYEEITTYSSETLIARNVVDQMKQKQAEEEADRIVSEQSCLRECANHDVCPDIDKLLNMIVLLQDKLTNDGEDANSPTYNQLSELVEELKERSHLKKMSEFDNHPKNR